MSHDQQPLDQEYTTFWYIKHSDLWVYRKPNSYSNNWNIYGISPKQVELLTKPEHDILVDSIKLSTQNGLLNNNSNLSFQELLNNYANSLETKLSTIESMLVEI